MSANLSDFCLVRRLIVISLKGLINLPYVWEGRQDEVADNPVFRELWLTSGDEIERIAI